MELPIARANAAANFITWWKAVDHIVGGKGAQYREARPLYDCHLAPVAAARLIILAREALERRPRPTEDAD